MLASRDAEESLTMYAFHNTTT